MPRPNLSEEKRARLVPVIARCFVERGYRRTTTAELAKACGVQEMALYRLWSGKKQMFLAAIEHVYRNSARTWRQVLEQPDEGVSGAEQLLEYESRHLGELGLYHIIFAGLSETDDPEIRSSLGRMFLSFQREISGRIEEHRGNGRGARAVSPEHAAWAIVGLGLVANLSRDVALFEEQERQCLIGEVGRFLLEGTIG